MPLIDGFDQLVVIGLFDIARPDPFEHIAEQIELRIGVLAGGSLCRRDQRRWRLDRENRQARTRKARKRTWEILLMTGRALPLSVRCLMNMDGASRLFCGSMMGKAQHAHENTSTKTRPRNVGKDP